MAERQAWEAELDTLSSPGVGIYNIYSIYTIYTDRRGPDGAPHGAPGAGARAARHGDGEHRHRQHLLRQQQLPQVGGDWWRRVT